MDQFDSKNVLSNLAAQAGFLKDIDSFKPKQSLLIQYDNSFIFDKDFEDKRFDRYVDRCKQAIMERLQKDYVTNKNKELSNNLTDFILNFLGGYYFSESEKVKKKRQLYSQIHTYYVEGMFSIDGDSEYIEDLFCDENVPKKYNLRTIVDNEIRAACKQYIRWKAIQLNNIDKTNYFQTQPKAESDLLYILKLVIDWVCVDIERYTTMKEVEELELDSKLPVDDERIADYMQDVEELEKTIFEKDKQLEAQKQQIKILEEKLKRQESKEQTDLERVINNNFELQRKHDKLVRKYNSLTEKYNDLKDLLEVEEDVVEKETELIEVDPNGKYLFVLSEESSFMDVITDAFPNVEFCFENKNISKKGYDMVVCITSHIDHSTYLGIKAQCKTNSIPFVHCKHSNIPLIRQLMSEQLNS